MGQKSDKTKEFKVRVERFMELTGTDWKLAKQYINGAINHGPHGWYFGLESTKLRIALDIVEGKGMTPLYELMMEKDCDN